MRCGVGDYTRHLAKALAGRKAEIVVLTSVGPVLSTPGIEVHPLIGSWRLSGLPGVLAAIDRIEPDVVHLQYPSECYGRGLAPTLLLPWLRWRRPRIKRVITLHEYSIFSRLGQIRLWPALAAADAIICTNHQDRRLLKQRLPGLAGKVRVIPLGSSLGHGAPTAWSGKGREWLAHFGMVMPNKGWETLVAAILNLVQSGRDVGVLVVAELQPEKYAYHRQVQNLIATAGLADRIRFTGYLEAEEACLRFRSCRIAVAPFQAGARLNRSSLVALLAQGLAVVTSQPSQPLEGLRHGIHYWTVVADDATALAEGIRNLLDHPELIFGLQRGAVAASPRFAWPRLAAMTEKLYNNL
jgi:glycosyltransferase involved in cell wall biosynthesis